MRKQLKRVAKGLFILCLLVSGGSSQTGWKMLPVPVQTRWSSNVTTSSVLPEYPRPQMVRKQWQNLNGLWEYAITAKDGSRPSSFGGQILVPYPIESALSGVKKPLLPDQLLWYRRSITQPTLKRDQRALLHFGAVDCQATVYVNGEEVGQHQGGYQQFSFDITDALKAGENEIIVKVYDPTDTGTNPRGKQALNPGGIVYTASSGIWQTVWLETVPAAHIESLHFTPDIDRGTLRLRVKLAGTLSDEYKIEAVARSRGTKVGAGGGVPGKEQELRITSPHLWSPTDPFLYDLSVRLMKNGKVVDTVGSYFGMRKIEVKKDSAGIDRIFLNNKYTYNLGVLDQGFWPDGLHTAPTDEALRFDVAAIKDMGFNTIRKHIKIEPARWYYHCDKLGMLVWQDMPNGPNNTPEAKAAFESESAANIRQLHNHPSIISWVLFNEDWGAYDQQRLATWMKQLDPSRLLNGHTGAYVNKPKPGTDVAAKWAGSDMTDIHAYPDPQIPPSENGKARVLGEFGGIGVLVGGHQWDDLSGWGYIKTTPADLVTKYEAMTGQLKKMEAEGLSGSIYTQPFDVETEANGLVTYDRKMLKMPIEKLRQLNNLLLPETDNFASANSGIRALPVVDPSPEREYNTLLAQYESGKRDLAFLRRLALLARSLKHDDMAGKIANDYIGRITGEDRFTKANIRFFREFTRGSTDKGFDLFYRSGNRVSQVMGSAYYAQELVDDIVAKEEIETRLFPAGQSISSDPDWESMTTAVKTKYDALYAERTILWMKIRWYVYKKNWPEYTKSYVSWTQNYGEYRNDLNNAAWRVFERSTDKSELTIAASWMEKQVLPQRPDNPGLIDTYANLLYKAGRTAEAITLEEKAVTIATRKKSGGLKSFVDTLDKMKRGEPTWPTNSEYTLLEGFLVPKHWHDAVKPRLADQGHKAQ